VPWPWRVTDTADETVRRRAAAGGAAFDDAPQWTPALQYGAAVAAGSDEKSVDFRQYRLGGVMDKATGIGGTDVDGLFGAKSEGSAGIRRYRRSDQAGNSSRTVATRSGSISVVTSVGSSPALASGVPQGSKTVDRPSSRFSSNWAAPLTLAT
jgi:hypothetical protein